MKIKVIQTAHSSESYSLGGGETDLKKVVVNNWPGKVSRQIKKYYPEIEVECWSPERTYQKEEKFKDAGVVYRIFPTTIALRYALDLSIPMIKELKKEVQKSKEQGYKLVIHVHEIHNLHGLFFAGLFKNDNVIVQHHGGCWPLRHLKESKKKRWFFPFFILSQGVEKLFLKNIRLYYTLSKDEEIYLKKIAPKSELRFQTMGIEEECYKKRDKKTARRKLGIPLNKKIILFVGRTCRIKGNYYLIDAMEGLPEVELKIIGYGQEKEDIERYTEEKGLKNVEFLGGIFGEKKLLYFAIADVYVLPSLREGAPVTVMESVAAGTPVVVTDVGGVALMVENGREGIIINQKSSEEIIQGVKEVLRWKNKNIRNYANKYKWKKIIDDTVEDYKKI